MKKLFCFSFCLLILIPSPSLEDEYSREQIVASYIYNFAQKISWPDDSRNTLFHIHLITSNMSLENAIRTIAAIKRLNSHEITVSRSENIVIPDSTRLVFVGQDVETSYRKIFETVEGRPILLVSDGCNNKRLAMINLIARDDQTIQFEINRANILNQGLGILPDMILLGGKEIDVAKLYKQAQTTLFEKEKEMERLERERKELQKNIESGKNRTIELNKQITTMAVTVDQQTTQIRMFKDTIAHLQSDIARKEEEKSSLWADINALEKTLGHDQEEIWRVKAEYESLSADIANLKLKLGAQDETLTAKEIKLLDLTQLIEKRTEALANLQDKLDRQRDAIRAQAKTISTQQSVLILLGVITVLVFVLVSTIFLNYRRTRSINIKLADQAEKLELASKDLMKAKQEAEIASRSKSIFLANMSHELRTPLNSILGFAQLLKKEKQVTAEQREKIGIILRSGAHLLQLIDSVLDIAKIEAGHIMLDEEIFELGALIRDTADMMRIRAEKKKLVFNLNSAPDLPQHICGDQGKLRQIIVNLVANAIKYTDRGAITVRFMPARTIEGQMFRLCIEVEDTGRGIAEADQDRVFHLFEQVGKPATEKGTGLGLTITSQYIQAMGGKISLRSKLDEGSLFRIEVPVKIVANGEIAKATPSFGKVVGLEPGQPTKRILIAEDDASNRMLIRRIIETAGFEVREAKNGKQAIQIFHEWKPDLIWMDRQMPVMDGLEATRQIKATEKGKKTKIIALTASVFKEERLEILAAGIDDFIRKPFREEEIFMTIARHLGVQFTFEKDEQHERTDDNEAKVVRSPLNQDALAGIPSNLLENLVGASESSDIERIVNIIEEIRGYNPALADDLFAMAANFDYDGIEGLISKKRK